MELQNAISSRRAIRSYKNTPVETKELTLSIHVDRV